MRFFILYILLSIVSLVHLQAQSIQKGVLDLSGYEMESLELNGEWRFYTDILTPQEINDSGVLTTVPSYWSLGSSYKGFGYGLYHLKVKGSSISSLAIRFSRVHTSYKVWINNELIGQSGEIGRSAEESIPGIYNRPIVFIPPSTDFDIYVGVSNFWHARGGMIRNSTLGDVRDVDNGWLGLIIRDVFLLTIIAAMVLYAMLAFWLGSRQKQYLYFSLFCLFSLTRMMSIESTVIGLVFPYIPYSLLAIFRYVGFYLGVLFVALFVSELFTAFKQHWMVKILAISCVLCSVGVIVGPGWWGAYISAIFQVMTLAVLVVYYFLLMNETPNRRRALWLVSLSVSALTISFVHDALAILQILSFGFWQTYGFTLAAICQMLYFVIENKTLKEKVDSLHASLVSMGLVHQQKQEFEKTLISELKQRINESNMNSDVVKDVLTKINSGPSIPVSQQVTIDNIKSLNQDFLYRLKKQHDNLTLNDIELCVSLKAKLTTKEIASIKNVSVDSVKKARSRLRQKLQIEKGIDLYQFFDKL